MAIVLFFLGWTAFYLLVIHLHEKRLAGKKVSFSLLWLLAFVFACGLMMLGVARFMKGAQLFHEW